MVALSAIYSFIYRYIRGNSSMRVTGIPEGEYRILFTLGTYWDKVEMRFRRGATNEEFVDSLIYREVKERDGTRYSEQRLTLHKVAYGNPTSRLVANTLAQRCLNRKINPFGSRHQRAVCSAARITSQTRRKT